jgi:hypothetical protein
VGTSTATDPLEGVWTQRTSGVQLQNHEQEFKNVLKKNVANTSVLWPVYLGVIRALKHELCSMLYVRDLTIKFVSSPLCACRGSSGQKPQYGLMTMAFQHCTAMLLFIYGSLFMSAVCYCLSVFWWLASQQCTCLHDTVREFLASKQIAVLEHPPYSLDLAPSDFFLFQR